MTRLRCSSENEVASPVVPSTFNPSQPLASRKRASATERAQSGSPCASTAVAMAAITPRSLSVISTPRGASPAHIERRDGGHIDELGVVGGKRHDLPQPVTPPP